MRNRDAILRREHGSHCWIGGRVRIVAMGATVARARAAREIPIAIHASMQTALKIAFLQAMTLTAQLHHIGIFQRSPIRQSQRIIVPLVVAIEAALVAMLENKPLMKSIQLSSRVRGTVGRCG